MNTGSARHGALRSRMKKLVLGVSLLALLAVPASALARRPAHSVRGHGIFTLNNPPSAIDQITINVSADESGTVIGGMSVWLAQYLAPPDQPPPQWAGWVWDIRIDTLSVSGNVATVAGEVIADNRFPEYIGCPVGFVITDNGSGAANPDILELVDTAPCVFATTRPILGGNFTVR